METMPRAAAIALALFFGTCAAEPRIGVLVFTDAAGEFQGAFSRGLRDHGFEAGKDLRVEWRSAGGSAERAQAIAAEFVALKVDVIVASLTPAVRAAQKATRTIPIVMAPAGDPVQQGFVQSLSRPGGNITGLTGGELSGKRLELLREMIPGLKRVSLLLNRDDPSFAKVMTDATNAVAASAGLQVDARMVGARELQDAFAEIARTHSGAVIVQPSLIGPEPRAREVAELALRHRLASISQSTAFVDAGGLASYGANFAAQYRESARFVARILKGEKPASMPVEQAASFDLAVNLRTAKALELKVPASVLLQATRVVE
jgi:putative ABC transport system substrate-binding protein